MDVLHGHNEKINALHKSGISKTMNQLNAILAHPTDGFQDNIDHVLTRILDISARKITPDASDQKIVFDGVRYFLNTAFANVTIKKFYNTAPKISLQSYSKSSLGKQVANNVYGKNRELFYDKNITGGSCYHRTIILKRVFDELQKKGLCSKTKIMFYNSAGGHSLLVIGFQGKLYIADMFGINHNANKIISEVRELPAPIAKNFSHFSFNKKQDKNGKILYFDKTQELIDNIAKQPVKNIALKFKPNLKNAAKEISVSINHTGVFLDLDGNKYTFSLPKNFNLPPNICTTHKILDHIFQNTTGNTGAKQELQKYLLMIGNKINPQKLSTIFTKEESN